MSNIEVFSSSQDGDYAYGGELGVRVFANGSTGTNSAVYNFPFLSREDDPETYLSLFRNFFFFEVGIFYNEKISIHHFYYILNVKYIIKKHSPKTAKAGIVLCNGFFTI